MEAQTKLEEYKQHIIHHIDSAKILLKKIESNMDRIEFSLTISDVDLLYIKTNIEMYLSNLSKLKFIYLNKKKLNKEEALDLLSEQKTIIEFIITRLRSNIRVNRSSECLIKGGFLSIEAHDSITNIWQLLFAYDTRIRRLIDNSRAIPGITTKELQELISTPQIRDYFRNIGEKISGEGEKLLSKEYHLEMAISQRWEKLRNHIDGILLLIDQQRKIVKRHKPGMRPMPKLLNLHEKDRNLAAKILEEDDLLKAFRSVGLDNYIEEIKRFEAILTSPKQ